MRVACRRVLLPFLSIVLSPRGGGVDGASTSPGPLPPPLAVKEEIESVNSVPHSPSDRSCAPGTTSITGRRRFPPHVSIMIRLVILFIWGRGGWGGNHVRDELQKPRLLISRPISWGFTKYFLTAIRDQTPPPPPPAARPVFSSTHPLAHDRAHLIPSNSFPCVPRQALTMGIVSLSFLDTC